MQNDNKTKRGIEAKTIIEYAVEKAKADFGDPLPLEYEAFSVFPISVAPAQDKPLVLTDCHFDVVSEVTYGTSEGIYGDIIYSGSTVILPDGEVFVNTVNDKVSQAWARFTLYSFKTLEESKEAYLSMSRLTALVAYYAREYVNAHIDQF